MHINNKSPFQNHTVPQQTTSHLHICVPNEQWVQSAFTLPQSEKFSAKVFANICIVQEKTLNNHQQQQLKEKSKENYNRCIKTYWIKKFCQPQYYIPALRVCV